MDSHYLQQQRFQLQKRFRRLNSCSSAFFHSGVLHLWAYLNDQPLLAGVLARIASESPTFEAELNGAFVSGNWPLFSTEPETIHFKFRVLQRCAAAPLDNSHGPEILIARTFSHESKFTDIARDFYEVVLEPLYEYLDESLDSQTAALSLLVKYKRKVEWFESEQLRSIAASGERALAKHLYAYLFDQGLSFHIEPQSASGEPDLVAKDLVLDAKVFDGERRSISTIASGVNQVHIYATDFNQDVGYLVVFKTCGRPIVCEFCTQTDLVPFIRIGQKTIYILVVDICDHEKTASKRGPMSPFTVRARDLIVEATQPGDVAAAVAVAVDPVAK